MARYESTDFLNPSIQIYFDLCMENMYDWEFEELNDDEFNRESFRDFLVKYDLQDFTDWLIDYQKVWKNIDSSLDEHRKEKQNKETNEHPNALKVSKILKLLLSGETTEYRNLEISIRDITKTEKIDFAYKDLFDQLKVRFIKEFERLGLNNTELSTEEAKEEIENGGDWEWYEDHAYEADLLPSDPWAVERYRLDHYRPREISLEIVNRAIAEIEMIQDRSKRGVGAKVKNLAIGELAKRLSYLHRIQLFLNNNEYSSINNYPLSNKTCRFIYEYFDFWGLLNKDVKFVEEDKEKRANYIKSLIRINKSHFKKKYSHDTTRDFMFFHDNNLELRIDLFKKVKDGLITPDEYYEIISSMK